MHSKQAKQSACLDCLSKNTGHVEDALPHEHDSIILQCLHAKLGQVWLEGYRCPVVTVLASCDLGLCLFAHVVTEDLQYMA